MVDRTPGRAGAAGRARPTTSCSRAQAESQPTVEKRVIVPGEDLIDAQPSFDQRTGEPIVIFRFNISRRAALRPGDQENVGKPFAIVLDRKVISAPVIREPIPGGSGQISGSFTVQMPTTSPCCCAPALCRRRSPSWRSAPSAPASAPTRSRPARSPPMSAPRWSSSSCSLTYGLFGLFANIALAVHVILIFGVLSLLGSTLTLPGIAGIVLTIGIAVELQRADLRAHPRGGRAGRTPISSLDAGFQRALATIIDSNVTTFIAAAVLFFLGTGPVQGFAVTLILGIVTTVFTAFTLTRLIVALWFRWWRPSHLPF